MGSSLAAEIWKNTGYGWVRTIYIYICLRSSDWVDILGDERDPY